MNTYYLVPAVEYEDVRIGVRKETRNKFDQATSAVVNAKGLTEEKRAEELRYLLNRYLNFKSSNRAQAEEDFEGMVKKIVSAFDGTVYPPAPTAVQRTPVARPATPIATPKGSFPESAVVQQLNLN